MSWFLLVYPLVGIISGFLAGLLGIGGGLVIVPALMLILPLQGLPADGIAHSAVATSLATVIVTSLVATYAHHRHQAVVWPVFTRMAPGLLIGALSGALIAMALPGGMIRTAFGIFALLVALQMGSEWQPQPRTRMPAAPWLALVGTMFGMLSAILGVGGGTLTVPFLRWGNILMKQAIATASACGFPIAVGGSLGYTLAESISGAVSGLSGAVYWPAAIGIALMSVLAAPVGARLTHTISTLLLTRLFALVLAIIGLRLIWL